MRKLSLGIPLLMFLFLFRTSDSPHGDDFRMDCSLCHNSVTWKVDMAAITFDHNSTAFKLSGSHKKLGCRNCHTSLVFSEAKTECVACHADMHEQTVGTECSRCHNTGSWLVSDISALHRVGRFPLVGAHAMADCQQCHKSGSHLRFDPLGIGCVDCHLADYNSTTKPNHHAAGFSTECLECHKMNAFEWGSSGFNHSFFPLTLGHSGVPCASCHKSGNYTNISANCFDCHQSDYNGTNNPSHIAAGFPTNCLLCHTTNPGWKPATIDHSFFPLTLGHSNLECAKCHASGNYANTSPVCVNCHQADYNGTTNPNHQAASFPTDCKLCHTTNPGWKPASFNHTWFPIYSGHHNQGVWNTCADCHTNASNYAVFSCINSCHGQSQTNQAHSDVSNYQYNSAACYSCHPTGNAGD